MAALKETASGPGWEMLGEETLRRVAARGGPPIFVSGLIGNWEVMPAAVAAQPVPVSRPPPVPGGDAVYLLLSSQTPMTVPDRTQQMSPSTIALPGITVNKHATLEGKK